MIPKRDPILELGTRPVACDVSDASEDHDRYPYGDGMTRLEIRPGEQVRDVHLTAYTLSVDLLDGRTITVPLVWYPRLLHATPEERANWQICGGGYGIHWPDVDEDLSTEGLLRGAPAPNLEPGTCQRANA